MKTSVRLLGLFAVSLLSICSYQGFAQIGGTNNTFFPVVTIQATDKLANWAGDTGTFTLFRSGSITQALNVYVCISGTATNGVDYQGIGSFVSIPPGVRSNTVVIHPIDLGQTDIRTVTLQLCPSPVMSPLPINYAIGYPNTATVFITPPGVTNLPPVVRITSPPNGSVFIGPIDLPIFAFARDLDGIVTGVEFFDGTNSIGAGHRVGNNFPGSPTSVSADLWQLVWSNAPVGSHVLTALATDDSSAVARSEAVNIKIQSPPPPPTNRPPIISIVASDPVAIEGTNCWTWIGLSNSTPTWPGWLSNNPPFRIFTNCGPKNATFTVRRHGATNDSLTVPYAIGGTASNGVDYVALSGSVTVPAGERVALISVVPIDDNVTEPPETVRLKLIPSASSPAGYVVGYPPSAAAIIVDSLHPRPLSSLLPGNYFHLAASGPDGAWFRIESSTGLRNWTPICTNQVVNGNIDFVDPDDSGGNSRFYRAVPESNPPTE